MPIDSTRGRRLMLTAAAVGLAVRLAFGLGYWVQKPLTHDEREYLALAASVSAGRGFVYESDRDTGTTQQFGRAPAYPLFLSLVGVGDRAYEATPARVKIAQSVIGALGVWVIGLLARRAAGAAAGVAAAAIASVYPPLVWICAYVLSEALYSTLALLTVLLLDRAIDRADLRTGNSQSRSGVPLAVAAGVAAGVSILVRPAMLFFLPLAAIRLIARRRGTLAVALVVTSVLVVVPWTARNLRVYHRIVLVASEGGVTFWTGNHPLARGEGDLAANPDIKTAEIAFRRRHPGLTAEELEPLYYREAIAHIAAHPVWWLGLLTKKAFFTIVPAGPSYALHSTLYRVSSVASYLILLPFAVAGAVAWRKRPHRPEALFLLAASAAIVCLVFFPQERFRIPVIDSTLIVCTGVWCGLRMQTVRTREHIEI